MWGVCVCVCGRVRVCVCVCVRGGVQLRDIHIPITTKLNDRQKVTEVTDKT